MTSRRTPNGARKRSRPDAAKLRLEDFLPYRFSVLSNLLSAAIAAAYSDRFDLSIPEWRVLAVLANHPDLSAAEVADRTAMDKVAVSRAVKRLLAAGRIERFIASADRRRSVLRLSAQGGAVYSQVVPVARDYERALVAPLAASHRAALDRILRVLLGRARELGPAELGPAELGPARLSH
jgi:DNA-binding MarR family transcriptional regulator